MESKHLINRQMSAKTEERDFGIIPTEGTVAEVASGQDHWITVRCQCVLC
jgi:hypothetical protein